MRPLLSRAPRAFTLSLLAAALAGCASTHGLAPQGQLLGRDALASAQTLGAQRADVAWPEINWWRAFGDPQLDALVAEAMRGTPSLAAADARVRQAIAQADLADDARRASLNASGQYSGVRIPESLVEPPTGGSYSGVEVLTLNLKYSPDLWGGQRARWAAAVGNVRAGEVDAQAARLWLASNIAHAYVALAQAFAAQDVANAEHERAAKLLVLGRHRADAGLDNQQSSHQAEAALAASEQQQQAAAVQIASARNALAALLGQGPDRGLRIERPTILAGDAPPLPDVLPSDLLARRPDVVAARWRVESRQRGMDARRSEFYPSINLGAITGLVAGHLSDLFTSQALLLQGGPTVALPIFQGARLRSQLAGSQADYDLAVADYNQRLVDGVREVTDAVQTARSLDQQYASLTHARDAAQGAWQVASRRYGAGLATQMEVLAAQQPLLQLDQRLATLRAQRLAARIDLDRALGGGLAPSAPSSDSATASLTP